MAHIFVIDAIMKQLKKSAAANSSPRRFRRLDHIVTEERIVKLAKTINQRFYFVLRLVPPPADEKEERRRIEIVRKGAHRALLGAFLYVQEHNPGAARAILQAGSRFAEEGVRGNEHPRFVVKRVNEKQVHYWMLPGVRGSYRQIVERLKAVWNPPPPEVDDRFVSRHGRYGVAQRAGTARRHQLERHRIWVTLTVIAEMAQEADLPLPKVTEKQVRTWLKEHPTPAFMSHRIFAVVVGKTPRYIKKLLVEAAQYQRESEAHSRVLDQWGFTGGASSVKPPSDTNAVPRPVSTST